MIELIVEVGIAAFLLCSVAPKVEMKLKEEHVFEKLQSTFGTFNAEDTIAPSFHIPKEKQEKIISTGASLLGTPYVFGGCSCTDGLDCSYFVQYVFSKNGIQLPRTAALQYLKGARVSRSALEPGDVIFFQTYQPGPSHVGIYIGHGRFMHASSLDGKVAISKLKESKYSTAYIGARRMS